ncbi:[FeFe] hydrogenase H-cluster maturation GTPase HydF, partial [bacterium]|nr:[FeFe] hydrogenase H-cluster maturation GTPase HydF [bacterium]
MDKTPKSLRLQIGLFGRTNVGKSAFLNMVAGQEVAITSTVPGTTTDVVEKTMELLPLGPVVFLDTAGFNDLSTLAQLRMEKTRKVFNRADVILLVVEPDIWNEYEEDILSQAEKNKIPVIIVVNKIDLKYPDDLFIEKIKEKTKIFILCSSIKLENRDDYVNELKRCLMEICPDDFLNPPALIGDLLPSGGLAILIVPIDLEAPKGRIILPQVQTIRDALDNDAACLIVKEREYAHLLDNLKNPPDIVVCDSQVVLKMMADTPKNIKCTTFSILFARYKSNLVEAVRNVL